nr:cytochrome c maturation protein CcmE [Sulfobacillus harzensis]
MQIGAMFVVGALAYMVLQGAHNFSSYFVTVKTYRAESAKFGQQTVRVQGTLLSKTVHYNPHTATLRFSLVSGGATLPVLYRGAMPNEQFHNAGAIAKGHMGRDGVFDATKLEIQCPDHYAPAKGGRS